MKRNSFITLLVILLIPLLIWAGSANKLEKRETFTITTSLQAGYSSTRDTFDLFKMYEDGYDAVWGKVTVHPSKVTLRGLGLADSAKIWFYSGAGSDWLLIDSAVGEGLPFTNYFAVVENDTIWRELTHIVVEVLDSTGDSVLSADYDVDWFAMRTGEKYR